MVNDLVGNATVVLQDVEVLCARSLCDGLCDGLRMIMSTYDVLFVLRKRTRISCNWSSGISVSFAPWCLGMTSCCRVLDMMLSRIKTHVPKQTHSMTVTQRVDIEKGKGLVALEELH